MDLTTMDLTTELLTLQAENTRLCAIGDALLCVKHATATGLYAYLEEDGVTPRGSGCIVCIGQRVDAENERLQAENARLPRYYKRRSTTTTSAMTATPISTSWPTGRWANRRTARIPSASVWRSTMPPLRKPRFTYQPGYPLPDTGTTTDREHCPSCGRDDIDVITGFTSGQALGICHTCGANYVVEPAPAKEEIANPTCPTCGTETFCNSGDTRRGGIFTCLELHCRTVLNGDPRKETHGLSHHLLVLRRRDHPARWLPALQDRQPLPARGEHAGRPHRVAATATAAAVQGAPAIWRHRV